MYIIFLQDKLILSGEVGTGLMQVRSQTKRHKSLEEEVSNHLPVVYELIERASDYGDESKKKTVAEECLSGSKVVPKESPSNMLMIQDL